MPSMDAALSHGLLDVLRDVRHGQPTGGAQLVLELERLHDSYILSVAGEAVSPQPSVTLASRGPVAQLVRAADS